MGLLCLVVVGEVVAGRLLLLGVVEAGEAGLRSLGVVAADLLPWETLVHLIPASSS